MSSFFGRMLSGQKGDLGLPLASKVAKIAAFGRYIEAISKGERPISMRIFVEWSNSWLVPEFRAEDDGKGVIIYQSNGKRWYAAPYRLFNNNLLKYSKLKVTLNGFTDAELKVAKGLTQNLFDELDKYIADIVASGNDLGNFDYTTTLENAWISIVGDLDATVKSSMLDRF